MANQLEDIQVKHARLDYLLKFLQIYVALKKEHDLIDRLEQEIKKMAEAEVPAIAVVSPSITVVQ